MSAEGLVRRIWDPVEGRAATAASVSTIRIAPDQPAARNYSPSLMATLPVRSRLQQLSEATNYLYHLA